jgi:hypothetical protein
MHPAAVARVMEAIGQVLGVDMAQLLRGEREAAPGAVMQAAFKGRS